MPETTGSSHFQVHVSEVEPAPVLEKDGWKHVDIRWVVGNQRAGSEAGSEEICFWRTVFPPGATHARHIHPNAAEAFFIIRGRGAAGTNDEEHEAIPGTALYVPAGVVHWFRNVGDEELELVGCYAPAGSLEDAGYEYVGEVTDQYRQVS
jgi:quercetin dioxygenase-like cupin family protein